ncbi:MAG TPA: RNA polymerase sigma factor [Polyangia bacterium]|jgi:RNA polymerase sigma-70 factor (ECF subfamily)|nr:RNA polymerase sigma factor [Polyangia bacterium]
MVDAAGDDALEGALIDRLRRGDRGAFRMLYARYAQATFRFLRRLCGQRDVAEDLHQETWLRVARHHRNLWPDSDVRAWIFAIARNTFASSRRRATAGAPARDDAADRTTTADVDPTCVDLERALMRLPEAQREILLLIGVEGLEIARVAIILELREDAVRQRLSRARAALAAALDAASTGPAEKQTSRGVR